MKTKVNEFALELRVTLPNPMNEWCLKMAGFSKRSIISSDIIIIKVLCQNLCGVALSFFLPHVLHFYMGTISHTKHRAGAGFRAIFAVAEPHQWLR